MSSNPETRIAVLETKHEASDEWRARTDRTLEKLVEALDRLTRIELNGAEQGKAMQALQQRFDQLDKKLTDRLDLAEIEVDKRFKPIEAEMPSVIQVRNGGVHIVKVIAASVLSAVIAAGSTLMLQPHPTAPTAAPATAVTTPH